VIRSPPDIMSIQEKSVLEQLATITYPGYSRDIVAFGVVRSVVCQGNDITVQLDLGSGDPSIGPPLRETIKESLGKLDQVGKITVRIGSSGDGLQMASATPKSSAQSTAVESDILPDVRNVIAVASGKGGVGKSTVAVNLSVALAKTGASVGLLDADIYGPSIPLMMGLEGQRPQVDELRQKLVPFERHGVRFMSLGFMVERDSPVIWRGPMVMKALEQLMRDVDWGELDILVVDMPPGTGDAQLTLSQKVRLAGAVIVTTPQDVALADAIKGIAMFEKVEVPVLGLIENMSYFSCPDCGHRSEIFGHGGGRREAESRKVPFLGMIPLNGSIREGGDSGEPITIAEPASTIAESFGSIAAQVLESIPGPEVTQGGGSIFDRLKKGLR
jgi:ATP-binding protein involved in chromosome partitioning